jgi:Cytochrome C assembly protein
MPKLDDLIAQWRKQMRTAPGVDSDKLAELENHLRETIERFQQSGMPETEAYRNALAQLGAPPAISSEFRKLNQSTWLPIKLSIVAGSVGALAMTAFLMARMGAGRLSLLLACHIFAITLGYSYTLLLGTLGICFVCQRCFSDFSLSRLQSISRFSFKLGGVAAGFTAIGIGLGMLWAKAEWGRLWTGDQRETAGLCVLIWLVLFMAAHRWRGITTRGILMLGIVGSTLVSLSWLAPRGAGNLHAYGTSNPSILAFVTAANVTFLLLGLAPAGWLRSKKANA